MAYKENAKEKHAAASKRWYEKNKALAKSRAVECNSRRREERTELINKIKNVPCLDCGNSYPPYVMDFDHRDPGQKSFSIGGKGKNEHTLALLLEEIAKCDVVCANCHRERTHGPICITPV